MTKTQLYYSIILLLGSMRSTAQVVLPFEDNVPITIGDVPLGLAWAGGVNYAQVGQLDVDRDGLKDMVLFDRTGNAVTILRNTGANGPARYALLHGPESQWPFSVLHDWMLLRDYDQDGKEDILSYSLAGFAVYHNTSDAAGLSFSQLTDRMNCDYVFTDGTSQRTNLYISSEDIPGFADIDGDGDMDCLVFGQLGTFVHYFKNLSAENGHGTDSLQFELRNYCWGEFAENASTNDVALDTPCQFQVPNPEAEVGGERASHVGSTVTPIELNGDGVMDLLLGDIAYANLVALINGGTTDSSHMISVNEDFPAYDVPVNLPIFPAPFQVDVDGDAVRDLVVCPSLRNFANNYESVWYYRNRGTEQLPVFEFQQTDLFQDQMIDVGEGAFPFYFDYNGDGLTDLLIANDGYYDPTGTYIGKIALLENTGSASFPAFEVTTDDYMDLSASGIGAGMYPAFADLDDDGDQDMYVADLQGRMHHYRNIATGPEAQFELVQPNVTYASGAVIDLGRYITPQFVDLDMDGLMDIVAGEQNGNLNYLRNTGTVNEPSWSLITDSLGGVNTSGTYDQGFSVPLFVTNDSGQRELMVGTGMGTIRRYVDVQDPFANWTLADSTFNEVDEGFRIGLALADITGDGEHDMVVGTHRGGIGFYTADVAIGLAQYQWATSFRAWPNPTTGSVSIVTGAPEAGTLIIYGVLGQELLRTGAPASEFSVDLSVLADGIHLLYVEVGGERIGPYRVMVASGLR